MKIGIDIRTLMDAEYSGVPEYTLNLIKEILKLDQKNKYKLFYNSWQDLENRIPIFEGENIQIVKTEYPNKIFNYLFQKTLGKPKIDELLGVDLFFMPHINFISLSSKCRKIITVHDLSFLRYPDFFSLRKNFWHRMVNVKKMLNKFDIIVAVSENTKKDIVELCGVDSSKIKVIYSGIEEKYKRINIQYPISLGLDKRSGAGNIQLNSNFQNSNNQNDDSNLKKIKSKYNLPEKFILFLATLEPRKNVDGLIKAFDRFLEEYSEFENYSLIIAGGKGWKDKKILDAWEKAKHKGKIKFLGYVDKYDKKYLYNLASLFAYPSFYEGFGFPPLEAMASGVPVITSNSSSLPEIAGDNAIFVNPYDIGEISEAIWQVLSDDNLRNSMIQKSLEHVKKFSWEETARKYIELFNN